MSDTTNRIQIAYDEWAEIYDTNDNPTRDMNYKAIRDESFALADKRVLEIGCGTGLNTKYLSQYAGHVTGMDISKEMLSKAHQRVGDKKVRFVTGDVTLSWNFEDESFDLLVANLVLEHVKNLTHVFKEAYRVLASGGSFYIAELHPFKQLCHSQAKFLSRKTAEEVLVDAFLHPVSEYVNMGLEAGFSLHKMRELQDEEDDIPRLLTLIFGKTAGNISISGPPLTQ